MNENELLMISIQSFNDFLILVKFKFGCNISPHPITHSEKICMIVNDEFDIELWNNDWVKMGIKTPFLNMRSALISQGIVLDINEVSLFDIYQFAFGKL